MWHSSKVAQWQGGIVNGDKVARWHSGKAAQWQGGSINGDKVAR